jgi:hypothetical protein
MINNILILALWLTGCALLIAMIFNNSEDYCNLVALLWAIPAGITANMAIINLKD